MYRIEEIIPSAEDYINLRILAGLSSKPIDAARIALKNSAYIVCIFINNDLIGIGRIIGDGGCFFEVVDIVLHPNHQKNGYGNIIMGKVMGYIDKEVPKGAFVSLIAANGVSKFYEKYGFEIRPLEAPGMSLVKK